MCRLAFLLPFYLTSPVVLFSWAIGLIMSIELDAHIYDELISETLGKIDEHNKTLSGGLKPNKINIATLTIMSHLTRKRINLIRVVRSFRSEGVIELLEKRGIPVNLQELDHSDEMAIHISDKKSTGGKKRTFQNSVIFKFSQPEKQRLNNKAVKIFCNGSLQVNGCKTLVEFLGVCGIVCDMLNLIYDNPSPEERFAVERFDVQLMNTNFLVPHRFNLPVIYEMVKGMQNIDSEFDVSFHPAINIKYMADSNEVSILVFNSGSIIITGVLTATGLLDAYTFITTFLDSNLKKNITVEQVQPSEKRRGKKRSASSKNEENQDKKQEKASPSRPRSNVRVRRIKGMTMYM